MAQEIFKREEEKWLLPKEEYRRLLPELRKHMEEDVYGQYTISNIYYDTADFRLIRESLEKPVYKEKLRLRLYGEADENGKVFAEIKKKYKGIVYKRRIGMKLRDARRWLNYGIAPAETGTGGIAPAEGGLDDIAPAEGKKASFTERQIFREISYMKDRYGLRPAVFIAYDRTALAGTEDPELRVTFDTNIRCRTEKPDLAAGMQGMQLLPPDTVLMEVKIPGAMPLWMAELFERITPYQQSFSKYGAYYEYLMKEKNKGGRKNAA